MTISRRSRDARPSMLGSSGVPPKMYGLVDASASGNGRKVTQGNDVATAATRGRLEPSLTVQAAFSAGQEGTMSPSTVRVEQRRARARRRALIADRRLERRRREAMRASARTTAAS